MPFRSFLKQKWIVKIRPEQSEINIDRDFFKREKLYGKGRIKNKSKLVKENIRSEIQRVIYQSIE